MMTFDLDSTTQGNSQELKIVDNKHNLVSEISPGGTDPHKFNPQEAWYPVYFVQDLDKSKPTPFTLLAQDIVIWWDKQANSWRVFEDKCPHRLSPLSEGRINENNFLECPYHGWTFSGEGKCEYIPQQVEGCDYSFSGVFI